MKAIFLDVDGPLVYVGSDNTDTFDIDYEKVKLLKRIVDATNASIVISSSWRYPNPETGKKKKSYNALETALSTFGLKIYGDLPEIKGECKPDKYDTIEELLVKPVDYRVGRAVEIKMWIEDNKPESFLILDDEDYEWSYFGYDKNWIYTTFDRNGGIQEDDVDRAISILNQVGGI